MNKRAISKLFLAAICFLFLLHAGAGFAAAQEDKLTLTVTPPLFKLNMEPGDNLKSSVKIVNNNSEPIIVYAEAMDFKGKAEGGVEFIQNQGYASPHKLSAWIKTEDSPIVIAPQQSREIGFEISVPEEAEPGGHYAAIAVGTKPPENVEGQGSMVKVSSLITSLILVKIKGDIKEGGKIETFLPDKKLYKEPKVEFDVGFFNTGNVHLQPKGEIIIYNPYNKELGRIKVNDQEDFGNVLPDSGRKWKLSWKGEIKLLDTGRHRAMLFLSYGDEQPQMASKMVYFWVADLKLIGAIVGSILIFFALLFTVIKLYVRRAVLKTQKELALLERQRADQRTDGPVAKKSVPPAAEAKKTIDLRARGARKL
jgi:hypothetical protein